MFTTVQMSDLFIGNQQLRNWVFLALIYVMKKEVWKYLNERVKVRAFGIEYTGIFKGADEDWVYLQCETTWVQIPWLEITSFVEALANDEPRLYQKIEIEPDTRKKRRRAHRKPEPELKVIEGTRYLGDDAGIVDDDSESGDKND
jgi:hypothetical protein